MRSFEHRELGTIYPSYQPIDESHPGHQPVTGEVQLAPLVESVGPGVAGHLLGTGLVEHDAQVGQVEHCHQPKHQIHEDHPGAALSMLKRE